MQIYSYYYCYLIIKKNIVEIYNNEKNAHFLFIIIILLLLFNIYMRVYSSYIFLFNLNFKFILHYVAIKRQVS